MIELGCALVLAVYVAAHARAPRWALEAALLAVAGWVGEVGCVRLYGLYQYDPSAWRARLDVMPVMVALIWPAVILSARDIARRLVGARGSALAVGVVTGALVVFDAALIEPIAVAAKLWSWNEGGVFGVPVAGLLGWGWFAALAAWSLERWPRRPWLVAIVAPLGAHAMIVATWWGALRWVLRSERSAWVAGAVVALASAAYTVAVARRGVALPPRASVPRAIATAFFAALLVFVVPAAARPGLAAWAALFAAPHLVMTFAGVRRVSAPRAA